MISIFMTSIFTVGLLFGCNTNQKDEQEPDLTEEPSEQRKENQNDNQGPSKEGNNNELNQKDEQKPDPTEEPSEEDKKKMENE